MGLPNDNNRLEGVQALRGIAALLVVAFHATQVAFDRVHAIPRDWIWQTGESGVDIFFVISGLVMGIGYYRNRQRSGTDFLRRRIIRIVPMYWLATTLKLLLMLAIPVMALHSKLDPWHIVASYLFIPARNAEGTVYPLLWVGWTLNFEMLFYVLFALALGLRRPLLPVLSFLLGVLALGAVLKPPHSPAPLRLVDPLVLEFLGGLVLARALTHGFTLRRLPALALGLCGAVLILVMPRGTDDSLLRALLWGVPALAIVSAVAASSWQPPALLRRLGDSSYCIYLFHPFIMSLTGGIIARLQPSPIMLTLELGLGVLLSALVGVAAYELLEVHILRRLNQWNKATHTPAARHLLKSELP
jgi:exopolysaccharide production protein ExoZ